MHVHTPLAFLGRHLAPHYGDEGPQERRLAWNLVFGGDEVLAHHFDQLTLLVRARACPHGGIRDAKCAAVSAQRLKAQRGKVETGGGRGGADHAVGAETARRRSRQRRLLGHPAAWPTWR